VALQVKICDFLENNFKNFDYISVVYGDNEIGKACSKHGEKINAYRILVGKPKKKKRLCGRPRSRWEDNNMMNLKEIEWNGTD
jgi:predicted RNA-binding protein YlqC (UPF0109 family)